MADVRLSDPCENCGRMLGGGYYCCPNCKINVCSWCGIKQITECRDVVLLKSGTLPKCPRCGTKLKHPWDPS